MFFELGAGTFIYKYMVKKVRKLTVDALEENVEDTLAWNRKFVSVEKIILDAFLVMLC